MLKRLRYSTFAAVVVLLAFGLMMVTGCGGQTPAPPADGEQVEPVKFKLGHATRVSYGPLYIAQEKGFFAVYNIEPELLIIEDESQYAAAVASGELQGIAGAVDREVINYAAGTPISLVLALAESAGSDGIVAKEEIRSVEDLKGATVGLDKSSTGYFFFLSVLHEHGVSEDEVGIQEMAAGEAGAAFAAGRLDAAVTWEPWLMKVSQRPGGHVLVTSAAYPRTIVDGITLRQDFVEQHPEAVTGLVKAWFDAIEFYEQNPDEGNEIIARAMHLSPEETAEMAEGVKFFGREANVDLFSDPADEDSIHQLVGLMSKFWNDKGILSGDVDADELIDPRFVEEAVQQTMSL